MKYFLDTEFHEYKKKPLFGKPIDTIELISIGIVSEEVQKVYSVDLATVSTTVDIANSKELKAYCEINNLPTINKSSLGKEYYAICKDFDLKAAWNRYDKVINKQYPLGPEYNKVYWIRENVLKPIWEDLCFIEFKESTQNVLDLSLNNAKELFTEECIQFSYSFDYKTLKRLINKYGKTRKQIAEEVYNFCSNEYHAENGLTFNQRKEYSLYGKFKPEFYGYYCDYDWVVFCWLFGRMIDLPTGFPMYCIDLKQELDRKQSNRKQLKEFIDNSKGVLKKHEENKLVKPLLLTEHPDYPKQAKEHNALADAKFNYELYKFLNTI